MRKEKKMTEGRVLNAEMGTEVIEQQWVFRISNYIEGVARFQLLQKL